MKNSRRSLRGQLIEQRPEETLPGSKDESFVCRWRSAGGFAVWLTAAMLAAGAGAGTARAESANATPQFALANFGWQSNLEDWEEPPTGAGHGPIKNDPAYPQPEAKTPDF